MSKTPQDSNPTTPQPVQSMEIHLGIEEDSEEEVDKAILTILGQEIITLDKP
jgi:hypothetical protein